MMRRGILLLVLVAACSSDDTQSVAPDNAGAFIAFSNSFAGYRGWSVYSVTAFTVEEGVHASGKRTEYINHKPEHGAREFPIGTIIVKEIEANDSAQSRTFAMVKRGGGYNRDGAAGWEWFELLRGVDPAIIAWRGVGPPLGEQYGGDSSGGCNTCHTTSKANDYVLSRELQLTGF